VIGAQGPCRLTVSSSTPAKSGSVVKDPSSGTWFPLSHWSITDAYTCRKSTWISMFPWSSGFEMSGICP
jgi:hypothetical protein